MSETLFDKVNLAFGDQVQTSDVSVVRENDGIEVLADSWTLVLGGDPMTSAWIAVDEPGDNPEATLTDTLNEADLASISKLNDETDGQLSELLKKSTDKLDVALAEMLKTQGS